MDALLSAEMMAKRECKLFNSYNRLQTRVKYEIISALILDNS